MGQNFLPLAHDKALARIARSFALLAMTAGKLISQALRHEARRSSGAWAGRMA